MVFEAIYTAIGAGALWIFICWIYRDYRNDVLKQQLFALRDRLFDVAADGRIPFNDPAYTSLRRSLNSFMYAAERLSFFTLVTYSITSSARPLLREVEEERRTGWNHSLARLSPELRKELGEIRECLNLRVAEHMVFTSPLLWMALLPLLAVAITRFAGDSIVKRAVRRTQIDEYVFSAERDEEHLAKAC